MNMGNLDNRCATGPNTHILHALGETSHRRAFFNAQIKTSKIPLCG